MPEFWNTLRTEAESLFDHLVTLRRHIHRYPELGLDTENTARFVEQELDRLQIAHRRFATTGVAAYLGTSKPGLALLLRADMDALPIQEDNDLPFKSENPGRMHACGHDAHTTVLLGTAALLKAHEADLPQPVVLAFQPAEEGPGGALPMIRDGLLQQPPVGAAMMVHVDPGLPAGSVGFKSGFAMASADDFRLEVVGRGGHGGHPNHGVDALVVAAQIVVAAQTLVSRMTDPAEPAVLTFGTIHGGWRENVLADHVELSGTIRTFTERRRQGMEDELRRLSEHIALASGATARLDVHRGYPPVFCDESITDLALQVASNLLGPEHSVRFTEPSMGAEDFSYFAALVPGTNCHLGVANPEAPGGDGLHSARFILDERALPAGVVAMAGLALTGTLPVSRPAKPVPSHWAS